MYTPESGKQNFPFEYYSISFHKFSGQPYLSFRKDFKHILLDNTLINNEYATNQYIKTLYDSHVTLSEKNKHLNEYRKYKNDYRETILEEVNKKTGVYKFGIKNDKKSNLVTDLTITEENIDIPIVMVSLQAGNVITTAMATDDSDPSEINKGA